MGVCSLPYLSVVSLLRRIVPQEFAKGVLTLRIFLLSVGFWKTVRLWAFSLPLEGCVCRVCAAPEAEQCRLPLFAKGVDCFGA